MNYTVVVTIGRNVDGVPMGPLDWYLFKTAVMSSLHLAEANVIQRPHLELPALASDQLGLWEGSTEEAACFVAFVPDRCINVLPEYLRVDAQSFKQQCIGCIVVEGDEHLVYA